MRAAEGRQALGQFPGHVARRVHRPGGDGRQPGRDSQQVLDPVAHLSCEKFVALFGLLSTGHVDEDAEHPAVDHAHIVALSPGGDPANVAVDQNAEIDLIGPHYGAGGGEGCADPVTVRRVNVGRKVLEGDARPNRHAPQPERRVVHGEGVVVDVP